MCNVQVLHGDEDNREIETIQDSRFMLCTMYNEDKPKECAVLCNYPSEEYHAAPWIDCIVSAR